MRKVTEYELLKEAGVETTKIAAQVLQIPEVEALRMSPLQQVDLLTRALPLMSKEQKSSVRKLNDAPRAFWTGAYTEVKYGSE